MTAQIAAPNMFSLELVIGIVAVATLAGATDLLRQPGWAWKRAEESKVAYLVLVLLLPLVGLGMYLFGVRPKVATIASAGRAASLPFERFGDDAVQNQRAERRRPKPIAAPATLGSFGELRAVAADEVADDLPIGGVAGAFFSTGGMATTAIRPPMGQSRAYRPYQRTSLEDTAAARVPAAVAAAPVPTASVPPGWKADPTGRHQFRYWDGSHWTENVADSGVQARDTVLA